jgi:hypothetical protein
MTRASKRAKTRRSKFSCSYTGLFRVDGFARWLRG